MSSHQSLFSSSPPSKPLAPWVDIARQSVEYNHRIWLWTLTLGFDPQETPGDGYHTDIVIKEPRNMNDPNPTGPSNGLQTEEAWRQQVTQMAEQIRQLQAALQDRTSTNGSEYTPSTTSLPAIRAKPTLPNPPKFGGERKLYEAWKAQVAAKIRADAGSLGSPANQFAYINALLEGPALQMCLTYFQLTAWTTSATPENFFTYLDRSYSDPNRKARATERLRSMKQGESTFAAFLPRFERALAEAGASDWTDDAKIAFLGGTLNNDMKRAMLGQIMPEPYGEYVSRLISLDGQLLSLRNHRPRPGPPLVDSMDWESTQAIRVGTVRNCQRLTPSELEQYRREGRCFRCYEKGHRSYECTDSKNRSRTKKILSVTKTELTEESESEGETSDGPTRTSLN